MDIITIRGRVTDEGLKISDAIDPREFERKWEFPRDTESIILRGEHNMSHLDLRELSRCTNLRKFVIQDLRYDMRISLFHLNKCSKLELLDVSGQGVYNVAFPTTTALKRIDLSDNLIKVIDLAPLTGCAALEVLNLRGNELKQIDLTPLSSCTNLKRLNLASNQLESIDFNPLRKHTELEFLNIGVNPPLKGVDLTPLKSCSNLDILIDYMTPLANEISREMVGRES